MKPGQRFISHGRHYEVDQFGAIHQTDAKPFKYDENYVQTYNSADYLRESELLQTLRFAYCTLAHRGRINSILDVGYGAGQFMRFARKYVDHVYGSDVTGIGVEGCMTGIMEPKDYPEVDVITFWDCWEHIEDHSFARDLKCKTIVISLPYCHIHTQGEKWFSTEYKHRKPDEHLYHYDQVSLSRTMRSLGWQTLAMPNYFEDVVRKTAHGLQNIITLAFKR